MVERSLRPPFIWDRDMLLFAAQLSAGYGVGTDVPNATHGTRLIGRQLAQSPAGAPIVQPCSSGIFIGGYRRDGDGGKWICRPKEIRARGASCLVYSIGSDGEFSFEAGVHANISSACEIHTFDRNPIEHYLNPMYQPGYPHERNPPYVQYHVAAIGPTPGKSIAQLVQEQGHMGRQIDILKIDCEGCEWTTFRTLFDSAAASIQRVMIEVHGHRRKEETRLSIYNFFRDRGYWMYHADDDGHNWDVAFMRCNTGADVRCSTS
jgi:hypothetical protein